MVGTLTLFAALAIGNCMFAVHGARILAASQTPPPTAAATSLYGSDVFADMYDIIPSTCYVSVYPCIESIYNLDDPDSYTACTNPSCACPSIASISSCVRNYCHTGFPTAIETAYASYCASAGSGGGLSQPAKIGIGVGAGVGGALLAVGAGILLVKAGVFAGAGAAVAGGVGAGVAGGAAAGGAAAGAAGAAGAGAAAGGSGAASSGATPAVNGDMTMAGKAGFYGYTPGGEATNFTSPPPGYAPTGGETAASFGGYGPTGTEGANFSTPGTGMGPTGAEGGNFTTQGTGMGPTGAEGGNFTSPGTGMGSTGTEGTIFNGHGGHAGYAGYGPSGTEGSTFSGNSGYGPTGTEGSTFSGHSGYGPTGTEGTTFSGNSGMAPTGGEGTNFTSPGPDCGPPPAGPPNPAYFAIPLTAAPLAAGAAYLGRRKQVGSPVSSMSSRSLASRGSTPMQQVVYSPPNMQHELGSEGVYYGSELGGKQTYRYSERRY